MQMTVITALLSTRQSRFPTCANTTQAHVKIPKRPCTHLQPAASPKKPPAMGPSAGPRNLYRSTESVALSALSTIKANSRCGSKDRGSETSHFSVEHWQSRKFGRDCPLRCCLLSEIVPPASADIFQQYSRPRRHLYVLVNGELPNSPARKRKMMREAIFWLAQATAFQSVNMMYVPCRIIKLSIASNSKRKGRQ